MAQPRARPRRAAGRTSAAGRAGPPPHPCPDTGIPDRATGRPHPFTLFDQTIDLGLLEIENLQVHESIMSGYDIHVSYPRPLIGRMRAINDDYRDLFAQTDFQGQLRELRWVDAADRDAAVRAFLKDRVDGAAPVFTVRQTCDGTTWLRIPTGNFGIELDGIPADIAERQIRRMAAGCRRN